jgi:hypothetical protein
MSNSTSVFLEKGRVATFVLFCLTAVQLVFQQPSMIILPDQRANLFSATLCLLTLVVTILIGRGKRPIKFGLDFWISVTLVLIVILSSIYSLVPRQSIERAYSILSPGLGGYWCAKFLLTEPRFTRIFQWVVNALLVGVIVLALAGLYLTGKPHEFLDSHWHPAGSRLLLLSFAPLSLMLGQNHRDQIIGWIIFVADLVTIYIVGRYALINSLTYIPGILAVVGFFVFKWTGTSRRILAGILLLTVFAAICFAFLNPKQLNREHISVAYRVESLFFSIDIAGKHPWLGNGLWAPRLSLLENYTLYYPFLSKEQFTEWTADQRTSENLYLTFLADLGIPFVILYFGSLLYVLLRLISLSLNRASNTVFHPVAIFLPLLGECLRFLFVDDLFYPQINWFFHMLWGLVVIGSVKNNSDLSEK